jgi:hypothetical protein
MLVSPAARDLAAARADLLATRQQLEGATAFQAELRADIERLEAGWRADQAQLQDALTLLSQLDAQMDAALAVE